MWKRRYARPAGASVSTRSHGACAASHTPRERSLPLERDGLRAAGAAELQPHLAGPAQLALAGLGAAQRALAGALLADLLRALRDERLAGTRVDRALAGLGALDRQAQTAAQGLAERGAGDRQRRAR